MDATAAIDTTGLAKRYGSTVALAGLTMRVASGHVFGFLGPNGAGKTTAVKLLLGLAGRPPAKLPSLAPPSATARRGDGSATCPSSSGTRPG